MKCANYDCTNQLEKYEIKKHSHKLSKWRFCVKCRRRKSTLTHINCGGCGCALKITSVFQKLYCKNCMLERIRISRRKTERNKGIKRIRTTDTNYKKVEDMLKTKQFVSINNICKKLDVEPRRLYPYIQFLRKYKQLNITTYYKLQ